MGLLIDGKWHNQWYDTDSTGGEFIRQDAQFRNLIKNDGSQDCFPAEAGRYHLFVSLACPWAHRTLIFRKLKKLENIIGVTLVKPEMLENGWEISDEADPSPVEGIHYLHQLYTTQDANYNGRVTVPVLWDKKSNTIVNNESADIIRILNTAFNDFTEVKTDFFPEGKRAEIDKINAFIYDTINNGVYKTGFATTQQAYEKHFYKLFDALDKLEDHLVNSRYLVGDEISEADWRLFTTLIRFDAVYVGHFKTNLRRIDDYPNLSNYLRDLYQQPGVKETVNFHHIKTHYYYSHNMINPTRIIPAGPKLDFARPHNRASIKAKTATASAS